MAKTKRRRAGGKKGTKRTGSSGRVSFQTFWTGAGKSLQKALKAERGWDQKTLLGRLQADQDLGQKVVDAVKRLLPAFAAVPAVTEQRTPPAPQATRKPEPVRKPLETVPSFNRDSGDFWRTCEEPSSSGQDSTADI